MLSQLASAVFWFHPLVWYGVRQLQYERERACDDYVLASGVTASDYASDLLAMVQCWGYRDEYPTAMAMVRRSQFEGRLCAIVDQRLRRGALSRRGIATGVVAACSLILPLAIAGSASERQARPPAFYPQAVSAPAAAPPPASPVVLKQPQRFALTRQLAMQAGVAADPNQDLFAGCGSNGGSSGNSESHSHRHSSDSDREDLTWSASGRLGDCHYSLKAVGRIFFNQDASAIDHISPDGSLEVESNLRGVVTTLTAKPSGTGTAAYQMTRNGVKMDFEREGGQWLASVLLHIDRQTAFAIDKRFPKLLREGGPNAVLDEVSRMSTGRAKSEYLMRTMELETLGPEDLRRIFHLGAGLHSDHDTARLLTAAAKRLNWGDESVRSAFLEASDALESDANRGRILNAFLLRVAPTREQSAAIIAATKKMESDYQKERILMALAARQQPDGELLSAYLESAQGIQSDFARRRVLAAIGR
jgi:hypothetical protein